MVLDAADCTWDTIALKLPLKLYGVIGGIVVEILIEEEASDVGMVGVCPSQDHEVEGWQEGESSGDLCTKQR